MASGRGAASGAVSGAGIGSMFGPWGAGIGAGLGGLIGMFGSGGDKPMSPELEALYEQELRKQENLNPMVEAVMRLAYSRLPRGAQQGEGPNLTSSLLALNPEAPRGDGDYAESPMVRRALHLQRVRSHMAQPLYDAIQRLAQMRMPRGFTPGATWAEDPRRQTAPPGFDYTPPAEGDLG